MNFFQYFYLFISDTEDFVDELFEVVHNKKGLENMPDINLKSFEECSDSDVFIASNNNKESKEENKDCETTLKTFRPRILPPELNLEENLDTNLKEKLKTNKTFKTIHSQSRLNITKHLKLKNSNNYSQNFIAKTNKKTCRNYESIILEIYYI